MKAHKYWSLGALAAMFGIFYTGYKNMKSAHKYFACSSLFCMIIAIYSGHEMISGKSKKRKTLFPMENSKAEPVKRRLRRSYKCYEKEVFYAVFSCLSVFLPPTPGGLLRRTYQSSVPENQCTAQIQYSVA